MVAFPDIRPSPLAGRWYPADPVLLAEVVDKYIAAARLPELEGEVIAVVAPHAGHQYSGPVAGYAFAALRGMAPEIVAVIAPMHHPYPYPLMTSAHLAYATPLGAVEIDQSALAELDLDLQRIIGIGLTPVRDDAEHSLEIELPFLQRSLAKKFKLLPVMLRDQSSATVRNLGFSLARILGQRASLLVASTDLSHFFPQKIANVLDGELLHRLANYDPLAVLDAEEEGVGFACGRGALAAVLWASKEMGADRIEILKYATSGDVTGDYDRVVGYASAVCIKTSKAR